MALHRRWCGREGRGRLRDWEAITEARRVRAQGASGEADVDLEAVVVRVIVRDCPSPVMRRRVAPEWDESVMCSLVAPRYLTDVQIGNVARAPKRCGAARSEYEERDSGDAKATRVVGHRSRRGHPPNARS